MNKSLLRSLVGEVIGTWILGALGLSAIAVSITTGALNYFESIFIFCFIVGLAVIYVAPVGGAHLNPAVTVALAVFSGFPKKKVLPYIVAQVFGAFLGAMTMYFFFGNMIAVFEAANNIVRGQPGSELTAMIFNCYSPHPFLAKAMSWGPDVVPTWLGVASEIVGTMVLVFSVYSFNDEDNPLGPRNMMFGFMIGLVLLVYVAIFAPISGAAVNPARDLGPRIAASLLGWGKVSLPGLASGVGGPFWIYQVGPYIGGLLGAGLWVKVCKPIIVKNKRDAEES